MSAAQTASASDPTLLGDILANADRGGRLRTLGRQRGEQIVTHAELLLRSQRVGGALRAEGVAAGDAVAVVLRPTIDAIVGFLGVWMAGGTVLLVPPPGPFEPLDTWRRDAAALTSRVGARTLVTDVTRWALPGLRSLEPTGMAGASVEEPPTPLPQHQAVITTTSGTTARARLLLRTQGSLHAQLRNNMATKGGLRPGVDHRLGWGPLHRRALGGDLLYPLARGVDATLLPQLAFAGRPMRWLEEISRRGATFSTAPAFAYRRVARELSMATRLEGEAALDLSRWRYAHLAGERVDAEVLDAFAQAAAPYGFDQRAFCVSYGSREIGNIAGLRSGPGIRVDRVLGSKLAEGCAAPAPLATADEVVRVVSVGEPAPEVELRLVDSDGREVAERQVGEVVVRGPAMSSGYLDGDDGDARFRSGWFHTQDLGYRASGELFLVGRRDEVVVLNGVNVHTGVVEQQVRDELGADVEGVAVFGVSGDRGDQLVIAVETVGPAEGLRARIATGLTARGARPPDEVITLGVGALPRTEEGKIKRAAVAAAYRAGRLPIAGAPRSSSEPESGA